MSWPSWWTRQPAPMLGLDISASGVKLVELGKNRNDGWVLERCAVEPLEPGWLVDGNIEKFDEVADAVRRVVKRCGSRSKNVALALPASAVITKKVLLPAGLNDDEMEVQVESEANQYIPFPLEDVSLDFCVIGPSPHSVQDVEVLLAASRKDKVQDRQGLAEAAGLKPVILDVASHASRRAARRLLDSVPRRGAAEPVVALFQIGALSTNLQVLRGDDLLYERDQSLGGALLSQNIANHFGLSLEEAESKKRNGDLPPEYAAAVLAPFVDMLAQDLYRSLQFFYTSTAFNKVQAILLAGGSAGLAGLPEAVTRITSFPATLAQPFADMEIADTVRQSQLKRDAPACLTACGLAMRRFGG